MIILNTIALISAIIAIWAQMQSHLVLFSIAKPTTTIVLIILLAMYGQITSSRFSLLIFLALLACLLGDIFLLRNEGFIYGLSAFFFAHLLFTLAFIRLNGVGKQWTPLIFLAALAVSYYLFLYPSLGNFRFPVAIYELVIVTMAWQAACLASRQSDNINRAIFGASLLFMFSDSIIALNKFVLPFELSSLLVLSTYWLSIGIITNASIVKIRSRLDAGA